MNSRLKDDRELASALGELPDGRSPRRDLWPGIAARLDAQPAAAPSRPAWRMPALAASLAIAFMAGVLLGQRTDVGAPQDTFVAGAPAGPGLISSLQQAETALLGALAEHPDNPYLGEKLLSLRAQQLEFLKQLHMLDQNSRRRT